MTFGIIPILHSVRGVYQTQVNNGFIKDKSITMVPIMVQCRINGKLLLTYCGLVTHRRRQCYDAMHYVFVRLMAIRLLDAKPLPNAMLTDYQLEQASMNLICNTRHTFLKCVWKWYSKMSVIFAGPYMVNHWWLYQANIWWNYSNYSIF